MFFRKFFLLVIILSSFAFSSEVGFVKRANGDVKVKRGDVMINLKTDDLIYEHDIILTQANSSVCIVLINGEVIALGEKSILPIDKHLDADRKKNKLLSMRF